MATEDSIDELLGPNSGYDRATLDDKGRLLLGKKLRLITGPQFVLNYGETGQLEAYSFESWNKVRAEVTGFDPLSSAGRIYDRLRFGRSKAVKMDPQGRIVLPPELRALAKIEKDVVLVVGTHCVEIWSETEFALFEDNPFEYEKARRESIDAALEKARKSTREVAGQP